MSYAYIITFHYRSEDESIDECDCIETDFKTEALAKIAGEKRLKEVEEEYKKQIEDCNEAGNTSYFTMTVCHRKSGHYEPTEDLSFMP